VCAGNHGFAGQQNHEWALYGTDGKIGSRVSFAWGLEFAQWEWSISSNEFLLLG